MYSTAILCMIYLAVSQISGQENLKIITIVDESIPEAPSWVEAAMGMLQMEGNTFSNKIVQITLEDDTDARERFCQALYDTTAVILDFTVAGWATGMKAASSFGIPYVHSQISIYQWMAATEDFLQSRNATDVALIFSSVSEKDQGLYYLLEESTIRVLVLVGVNENATTTLKKMRPSPSSYVLIGPGGELQNLFDKAIRSGLVTRDTNWLLVMTSQKESSLRPTPALNMIQSIVPDGSLCCHAFQQRAPCSCSSVNIKKEITTNSIRSVAKALVSSGSQNIKVDCNKTDLEATTDTNRPPTDQFSDALREVMESWPGFFYDKEKMSVYPDIVLNIFSSDSSTQNKVGEWSTMKGLSLTPSFKNSPVKRVFNIGSFLVTPWMYKLPKGDGSSSGIQYSGYCMELIERLAKIMNFEYKLVFPEDNKYGAKQPDGSWNGLIGDLAQGNTDIIVAPLTITSEREEVIDFVFPYFDQSGISIVIRKKEREESLFKFMTVLKAEVWVSIVAALVVTGIMIWLLDKYSPYSAQNRIDYQLRQYRKFTLKESFWFALTSFTPQGGGEAPKALSGRTLVAAYWLFVVLMLATFTANLAAFLTVERLQTSVQSLDELASQAKIEFSTVKGQYVYEYFSNMAHAEDKLFSIWKDLTLNSPVDQSKYRVWDYPIKEQYTHILEVIKDSGMVESTKDGIDRVLKSKGDFAFIHDAAEIRYEIYQSCFLVEVGEPFAEQPYAIAVQQGSHLQDEISKAILELQKDRYFEALNAKYWNSSAKGECSNDFNTEGINLQSLGGVFIATLIGLVLALVALGLEVMYYRKLPNSGKDTPQKPHHMIGKKHPVSKIKVSPAF